ncbi:MAG: ABC transporter permease [Pseudomonadota bacterium]
MTLWCALRTDEEQGGVTLSLKGDWTVFALPGIKKEMEKLSFGDAGHVTLDGGELKSFDISAAWYLDSLMIRLRGKGLSVGMLRFREGHRRILERVSGLPHEKEEPYAPPPPARAFFTAAGRQIDGVRRDCVRGIVFFGEFLTSVASRIFHPKHLRFRNVVFHINDVGVKAIPIIALMAFSIAFVTGYQGASQLQKFDATIYTIDLMVLSILREMGVLITAIMLAGRSGSAFAAQLGTMKLNEEVDALQTMGVSPFEVLVLPRVLAILIALPLLTILADMMGLLGGYVFSSSFLGYSHMQFLSRMQEAADMQQFYVGLCKAPVFAVLIGIVGCMQGLQARGSAEDVGRKTITAVVQSIFLVIVADAVFSIIFTKLGI